MLHERLKAGELEMARRKWEGEGNRLRDHYETPEGFMNAATEKAVVTSFFKDKRCFNLFSQVAAPVTDDALAVLRDHIRQTDPTFNLPEDFQALAAAVEDNVYLCKGWTFNFEELTTTWKEEDEEEKEAWTEVMEEDVPVAGVREEGTQGGLMKIL